MAEMDVIIFVSGFSDSEQLEAALEGKVGAHQRLLLGMQLAHIDQLSAQITQLDTAIAEAQLATKRYAKRQMTWFRNRMGDWNWRESADLSNIIALLDHNVA